MLSRHPPSVTNLCRGPLLQTLVADLCVDDCSLQGACRGATFFCREMAAQACYKANVLDSLPYIYIYTQLDYTLYDIYPKPYKVSTQYQDQNTTPTIETLHTPCLYKYFGPFS